MAHFKRGRCRYLGKTRRNSTSFTRKRLGLKPVIMPDWPDIGYNASFRFTLEYMRQVEARRRLWPEWVLNFYGNSSEPRWWTILHHNRPRRSREREMARQAVLDRFDLDNATWPLSRKPHIYYW